MKPFTVLVFNSALGFESVEEYATFFRLPVSAFYELTAESEGQGMANALEASQAEHVSGVLYALYEMVKAKLPPGANEDRPVLENMAALRQLARQQLTELHDQIGAIERALTNDDEDAALVDALDALRATAENLAFSAFCVDATAAGNGED